jgi:hypothetical protein
VTVQIAANTTSSPTSVATGGAAFDPLTGGTTTVSATAPGFDAAFPQTPVVVTVSQPAITFSCSYGERLGINLQQSCTVSLGGADHGGVTVEVTSSDAAVALVAPDATTAGSGVVNVAFANGEISKTVYVQGASGATAGSTATLTATQALFSSGTQAITVEQPVFRILNLVTSPTSLSSDDPFTVRTYLANGSNFWTTQAVSAAAAPLTVTLSSSDAAVGQLVTTGTSGASVTVQIAANTTSSPTSVATGGAAFDPLTGGTTTVSAAAPGFDAAFPQTPVVVTVSQPAITLADASGFQQRIGSGLQQLYRVTLDGPEHGGVTIRVTSGDPSRVLVAADGVTSGTSFIDLTFVAGDVSEDIYLQAVNGVTGTATISATNSADGLFASDSIAVTTELPVLRIVGLGTSKTVASANDPFYVQPGLRNPAVTGTSFRGVQPVSAAGGPVEVLLTSSDAVVGELTTLAQTGASVTVQIPVNATNSPTTYASGGVEFDALAAGTTTVSATALDFDPTLFPPSQVTVNVSP